MNWYPGSSNHFDRGLASDCRDGHIDCMIEERADDWDLDFACQGEQLVIMNTMIKRGLSNTGFETAVENERILPLKTILL